MASLPLAVSTRDAALASAVRREPKRASRRSVFRRLYDAMIKARQAEAERVVAHYIKRTGGRLSDSVEREIERLFTSGNAL